MWWLPKKKTWSPDYTRYENLKQAIKIIQTKKEQVLGEPFPVWNFLHGCQRYLEDEAEKALNLHE